jgi:hypothetical protein
VVEADRSNTDTRAGGLFKGSFGTRAIPYPVILDFSDGVERCPHCAWELEDGRCNHCMQQYRSDDGESEASFDESDISLSVSLDGEMDDDISLDADGQSLHSNDEAMATFETAHGLFGHLIRQNRAYHPSLRRPANPPSRHPEMATDLEREIDFLAADLEGDDENPGSLDEFITSDDDDDRMSSRMTESPEAGREALVSSHTISSDNDSEEGSDEEDNEEKEEEVVTATAMPRFRRPRRVINLEDDNSDIENQHSDNSASGRLTGLGNTAVRGAVVGGGGHRSEDSRSSSSTSAGFSSLSESPDPEPIQSRKRRRVVEEISSDDGSDASDSQRSRPRQRIGRNGSGAQGRQSRMVERSGNVAESSRVARDRRDLPSFVIESSSEPEDEAPLTQLRRRRRMHQRTNRTSRSPQPPRVREANLAVRRGSASPQQSRRTYENTTQSIYDQIGVNQARRVRAREATASHRLESPGTRPRISLAPQADALFNHATARFGGSFMNYMGS